ncbi:MAG: hypothetical protein QOG42_721 [Solirubrobacteraceae bacterium]|jgi:hypothetical protein|nr:hypothetical protein [Solirubrobacteraceae bacterium]
MVDENPPEDRSELSEVVKSRILDRLLDQLAAEGPMGSRSLGYTRSDSGLYGKYEKADLDAERMLAMIQAEVERAVAEARNAADEDPAGGGR